MTVLIFIWLQTEKANIVEGAKHEINPLISQFIL